MDSFIIFGFLVAVFLQLIPPQFCEEILNFEKLHEDAVANKRMKREYTDPNDEICYKQEGQHFARVCENIADYPLEKIEDAIKYVPSSSFVGIQGTQVDIVFKPTAVNGTAICESNQVLVFPQRGTDVTGKRLFIVNHIGRRQGVIVTTCSPNNKGCGTKVDFPSGYIPTCTQQSAYINLVTYDEFTDAHGINTFSVGSCCMCTLKPTNAT